MSLSSEQTKELQRHYGYATSTVRGLIEADHRRPRYSQVVQGHGPEGDLAGAGDCPLCVEEADKKRKVLARKELLFNDLLGDTVFVRGRGYKTMRKAIVEVRERAGNYVVWFRYEGEDRGQDLERIPRLDVVIEGERVNVWDDGEDDLPEFEQGKNSNSAKKCEKTYEEIQSIH